MRNVEKFASELLAKGWSPDETVYIQIEFDLTLEEALEVTDEMARQFGSPK